MIHEKLLQAQGQLSQVPVEEIYDYDALALALKEARLIEARIAEQLKRSAKLIRKEQLSQSDKG